MASLPPAAALVVTRRQRLDIRFTGSGSEYFRIWIVNLLLTILTLGVYHPWAKVRRLRYFHGNTLVGGHPLDFHGEPRQMVKGTAVVGAFVLVYAVAGSFRPGAQAVLVLAALVATPALLWAALRFRLSHTSWRGLRFGFTGTLAGAYRSQWPVLPPLALLLAVALGTAATASAPSSGARGAAALAGVMLLGLAMVPLWAHQQARYRLDHAAFAELHAPLQAGAGRFYGVFVRTAGVALLVALAVGLAAAGIAWRAAAPQEGAGPRMLLQWLMQPTAWFTGAALVVAYLALLWSVKAYHASRMQNAIWHGAGSEYVRFHSRLAFLPMFGVSLTNLLLLVLTLGLYWPFAQVAMARLRLEAVWIELFVDIDALASKQRGSASRAVGDAGADAIGMDIGL